MPKGPKKGSIRDSLGLSQDDLARLYKVSRTMIALCESKKRYLGDHGSKMQLHLLRQNSNATKEKLKKVQQEYPWHVGSETKKTIRKKLEDANYYYQSNTRKLDKLTKVQKSLVESIRALELLDEEGLDSAYEKSHFLKWKDFMVLERKNELKTFLVETQLELQLKIARYHSEMKVLEKVLEEMGSAR